MSDIVLLEPYQSFIYVSIKFKETNLKRASSSNISNGCNSEKEDLENIPTPEPEKSSPLITESRIHNEDRHNSSPQSDIDSDKKSEDSNISIIDSYPVIIENTTDDSELNQSDTSVLTVLRKSVRLRSATTVPKIPLTKSSKGNLTLSNSSGSITESATSENDNQQQLNRKFSERKNSDWMLNRKIVPPKEILSDDEDNKIEQKKVIAKERVRRKRVSEPSISLKLIQREKRSVAVDYYRCEEDPVFASFLFSKERKTDSKWEDYISSLQGDFSKVKPSRTLQELIRTSGIPLTYRGQIWLHITNAHKIHLQNESIYKYLVKERVERTKPQGRRAESNNQDNPDHIYVNSYDHQIEIDLPRTFPHNEWFNTDAVQDTLRRILHAYTWYKPEVGYCQAMNFLAATLLIFIKQEEMCFWTFTTIMESILPVGFYSKDLMGLRVDVEVFKQLFVKLLPKLSKHFENLKVDCHSFIYQWFLSLFITVLPQEMSLRFLDSLFYDGSKMLFRIVMALLSSNQKILLSSEDTVQLYTNCKGLPKSITNMDSLMALAYEIPLTNSKLDEMRKTAHQFLLEKKLKLRQV